MSCPRPEGTPDRPLGSRFLSTLVGAGLLASALLQEPPEALLPALARIAPSGLPPCLQSKCKEIITITAQTSSVLQAAFA